MPITLGQLQSWMNAPEGAHLEFKEAKHNFHYDNPCDRRDGAGVAMTVSACNNRAYHCDTRQSQSDAMSQWLPQSGTATGRAQRHSGMIHGSSPVMGDIPVFVALRTAG